MTVTREDISWHVNYLGAGCTPQVWRVYFVGGPKKYWWDWICGDGYLHVVATAYCVSTDCYLVFDPRQGRTCVTNMPKTDKLYELLAGLKEGSSLVLEVVAGQCPTTAHRFGLWCSTQVARLVGHGGSAWRPLALARSLVRSNATVIHEAPKDGCNSKST